MNNPQYVKIAEKMYKINTDFRVAIECNNIALDTQIGDYERALAIIFKLFGEEGLECENQNKLLELGMQYISIDKGKNSIIGNSDAKYELDINKCKNLIRSSFIFDYKYNPYDLKYLHWYDFYNDLRNLSTSEFGNCCILNRVISILNQDASKIKDSKDRSKLIETQQYFKEKYCIIKKKVRTKKQEESAEAFFKALNITN